MPQNSTHSQDKSPKPNQTDAGSEAMTEDFLRNERALRKTNKAVSSLEEQVLALTHNQENLEKIQFQKVLYEIKQIRELTTKECNRVSSKIDSKTKETESYIHDLHKELSGFSHLKTQEKQQSFMELQ